MLTRNETAAPIGSSHHALGKRRRSRKNHSAASRKTKVSPMPSYPEHFGAMSTTKPSVPKAKVSGSLIGSRTKSPRTDEDSAKVSLRSGNQSSSESFPTLSAVTPRVSDAA